MQSMSVDLFELCLLAGVIVPIAISGVEAFVQSLLSRKKTSAIVWYNNASRVKVIQKRNINAVETQAVEAQPERLAA